MPYQHRTKTPCTEKYLLRAQTVALATRREEEAKLQDEVMADVYSQADAMEDNGEGSAGPSDAEVLNT